jgi:hypothetical protein
MMRRLSVSNTVLLIICLMYLILYVDRVNISIAAPLIKADLALTNTQLGLAFSAFAYSYALFQLIGGYFGDKFGPRLTLCISSLIVCVATACTSCITGLNAATYQLSRGSRGGGDRRGRRPRQPICRTACVGRRRRRDIPDCDARHVGVDSGARLGLCAGPSPIHPRGSAMQ